MPKADKLRNQLVDTLIANGSIRSEAVEAAFRTVPRHLFVPDVNIKDAYKDDVIPVKFHGKQAISSSSQPTMMAIMLEQLDLQPGMRVMEIGAGTGYNAALMAHIVGESGSVVTIDLDEDLVQGACAHLQAAGVSNVTAVCADGAKGYAHDAPYDRIILTVAAWDICAAWLKQLAPDGRIVMPLIIQHNHQVSVAFQRNQRRLESVDIRPCRFMMLRGGSAVPQTWDTHAFDSGITIYVDKDANITSKVATRLFDDPKEDYHSRLLTSPNDLYIIMSWLNLQRNENISVGAEGEIARDDIFPVLYGNGQSTRFSSGLIAQDGMALWGRQHHASENVDPQKSFELYVRAYGASGGELATRLIKSLEGWYAAGRPDFGEMQISVMPHNALIQPEPGQIILEKPSVKLVVRFGDGM